MGRILLATFALSIIAGAGISGALAAYRHLGVEACVFFSLMFMLYTFRGVLKGGAPKP